MKKSIVRICVFLPAALALAVVALFLLTPLKTAKLGQLRWSIEPPLISVADEAREQHLGLLLLRLKDGKEQFIAGLWQTFFAGENDVFAVGEFPPGYSTATGTQMFAVKGGSKLYGLSLNQLTGQIASVQENRLNTYVAFEIIKDGTRAYCLMDWSKLGWDKCDYVKIDRLSKAAWLAGADHEFAVQDSTGTVYLVDPWENGVQKPKAVSPDKDARKYAELTAALAGPAPSKKSFDRFLNFIRINDGGKSSWHRLPLAAKAIAWLPDGEHLLVKEMDRLGIYEIATRSYAPLLTENGLGRKAVRYRKDGDRTL